MNTTLKALARPLIGSLRDLLPVIVVVLGFQLVVLQEPLPNMLQLLSGTLLVVLGLTLFIKGLEMGLFPVGESLANALARKGSLFWLLIFAFALGFGTTVAEPALIAVAEEASEVAAQERSPLPPPPPLPTPAPSPRSQRPRQTLAHEAQDAPGHLWGVRGLGQHPS